MKAPLIFFVHVPKTAGSTVNFHLEREMGNGIAHCESLLGNDKELKEAVENCDWLSGHVPFEVADARIRKLSSREIRYFATIREPFQQVMSHYNWLHEIYYRDMDFYNAHPDMIKNISKEIREKSKTIDDIIDNLSRYAGLFQNIQSRYLLGNMEGRSDGELILDLKRFEYIANENKLKNLINKMTKNLRTELMYENRSPYRFDVKFFESPRMKEFLNKWIYNDIRLYNIVSSMNQR